MSHVASVDIEIGTDLAPMKAACAELGLELVEGQTTHAWWGAWLNDWSDNTRAAALQGHDPKTFGTCRHAIRVLGTIGKNGSSGPWEIGLVARRDGKPGYEAVYDSFGSAGAQLEKLAGKDLKTLKGALAAHVSARLLQRQGYRVNMTTNAQGERQVIATKA